jgi:hypothetical protein
LLLTFPERPVYSSNSHPTNVFGFLRLARMRLMYAQRSPQKRGCLVRNEPSRLRRLSIGSPHTMQGVVVSIALPAYQIDNTAHARSGVRPIVRFVLAFAGIVTQPIEDYRK